MRITLIIEDKLGGGVSLKSDPTFEQLANGISGGVIDSSAAGYALHLMNAARAASRKIKQGRGELPVFGKPS
jgi:hypothetical protein